MRTLRSISIAGLILGTLFKTLHWPGGNILLLTSGVLTILTLAFLLAKTSGPMTIQLPRPAMLFGSVMAVVTGLMFKVMHWPGANMLLLVGLSTCAVWFLLAPLRSQAKTA